MFLNFEYLTNRVLLTCAAALAIYNTQQRLFTVLTFRMTE